MSNEALKEYLKKMRLRYQEAGKFKRTWLLDEVSEFCGFSRDHTRKVLSGRSRVSDKRPRRKWQYSLATRHHLRELWYLMGGLCSKRMKVGLPLWLKYYSDPGCTPEVRAELLRLSPSTMDRILKTYRKRQLRGLSATKGSKLFKNRIPLKLLGEIIEKPGFMEADTVAHCGNNLAGDFIYSLTMTDVCTSWTENRAVWNKKSADVLSAVQDIEKNLPFNMYGFSCDNGSEFINENLAEYFLHAHRTKPVQFVRGRAYKKNDNPHVEQKNFTHVRQLLGYKRLDRKELVEGINRIYKTLWNPLHNFFYPSARLAKKERIGARIKKTWDAPQTPYQRLLQSGILTDAQKGNLKRQFELLNPFVLQFRLRQAISVLNEFIRQAEEGQLTP